MLITKLCLTHLRYAEARLPSLKQNLQINGIDSQTLEREANIGVMIRNFTEFTAGYLGPRYYGAKTLSMQAKKTSHVNQTSSNRNPDTLSDVYLLLHPRAIAAWGCFADPSHPMEELLAFILLRDVYLVRSSEVDQSKTTILR